MHRDGYLSLWHKLNQVIDDLSMTVTGGLNKHLSIEDIVLHIVYDFKGKEPVKKAVADSQEK